MDTLEMTLEFANKFDEIAKTEQGQQALDYASDIIDDWAELAAAELKRRVAKTIFDHLTEDDLIMMTLNDDHPIDFNTLAWEAVKKARGITA